jgi:hypothetical protein
MARFAHLPSWGLLLGLSVAAAGVSAETVWLRGRGADVWIEKDGQVQEPRKNRKGFTRVVTPSRRVANPGPSRAVRASATRHEVVEIGPAVPPHRVWSGGYPYRYGRHRHRGYAPHRYGYSHSRHRGHHVGRYRDGRVGRHRSYGGRVRSGGAVRGKSHGRGHGGHRRAARR